jgi:hypothetical protein
MFRRLKADKDSYVTNKFVNGVRAVSGNVGYAGSLDLFKLYGMTVLTSGSQKFPQTEISRLLLHFDLEPLKNLVRENKVDIDDESFKCHLFLKDVYGGQPTPSKFFLDIFPLSASFDEGIGKDVAYYADFDRCNFLSSSNESSWFVTGCGLPCFSTGSGDYITSSMLLPSTLGTQFFDTGEEDLYVDVTKIVSATIVGDLPDSGLRVSYRKSFEEDNHTYFVKRFGSRHAYDESKRPYLFVRFKDAIEDDGYNLYFDTTSKVFLYNYPFESLKNLVSSSQDLVEENCLLLTATAKNISGSFSMDFNGSQFAIGKNYVSGTYYAEISLPSTNVSISDAVDFSGSVKFDLEWKSLDETTTYLVKKDVVVKKLVPSTAAPDSLKKYTINVRHTDKEFSDNEEVIMRVDFFDENDPYMLAKRLPVKSKSSIIKNCYYGIRDVSTGEYAVPFDSLFDSTLLSSDSEGMYIKFHTSSLFSSREYTIDLLTKNNGVEKKYMDASQTFRIKKL